jgi:glyoxylase-like metal-dependent hydrolase (beta-lactamase superfamily II)
MIHLIDALHLGRPKIICVALLEAAENSLVMIDCGPENVFESLVEGIARLGFEPSNVKHLLATHIHLDHSGGAWRWAKEFGTKIYVHPKGAPHMIDPQKLIGSATRIYGDKMEFLWGKIEPIPVEQVVPTDDNAHLRLGRVTLDALYTPGHAQHHNAYWLAAERTVFAGDVAGVIIDDGPAVPPFPPPDIHLESWRQSIATIRALAPQTLHITHFGRIESPLQRLAELEARILVWANWMKERLREGKSEGEIVSEFAKFTEQELLTAGAAAGDLGTYEQADPASMSVAGLSRYWRRFHPEVLA